eukprot:6491873-Amphidinium_carterae.1
MDECTKSVTAIVLNDIQDKYTEDEVRRLTTNYPQAVAEGEDGYDDYMDLTVTIKMMRGDIVRRVLRQSESWRQLHFAGGHQAQQFSLLCTIMQPSWNIDTQQFTKQYYKWLQDINRYEALQWSTTSRATLHKKPDDEDQSSKDIDDVHQWISNYFNSTYTGTEDDNGGQVGGVSNHDNENYDNEEYNEEEYDEIWDYDNNDPVTIAFIKGIARGQRKGKKEKKRKKGDNSKGKDGRTITCYTCGKQGHTLTFCYYTVLPQSSQHLVEVTKALYGLRASPKQWQEHLSTLLKKLGFTRLKSDACVFANKQSSIYLIAYVDDLLRWRQCGYTTIPSAIPTTLGVEAHYTVHKVYYT